MGEGTQFYQYPSMAYATLKLENDYMKIEVSLVGAELQSLYSKKTELEYLWQPGYDIWPHHAARCGIYATVAIDVQVTSISGCANEIWAKNTTITINGISKTAPNVDTYYLVSDFTSN